MSKLARVFDETGGEGKIFALNGEDTPAEAEHHEDDTPANPPAKSGRERKGRV